MRYFAILTREESNDKQTIGSMQLFDEGKELLSCYTIELPWKDNEKSESCIPEGIYSVSHRWSDSYGYHFIINDVPDREYILIHAGNFYTNTEGCVLVGEELYDIDSDGYMDITNSQQTLANLINSIPRGSDFELKIITI